MPHNCNNQRYLPTNAFVNTVLILTYYRYMKITTLSVYLSIIALLFPALLYAQNLVPNSGFEVYNACPNNLSDIAYSPGYTLFPTVDKWVGPVSNTSPDYYNTCGTGNVSIPNGIFGYQMPHGGNAYVGIVLWEAQYTAGVLTYDYREYIQCKLLQPLQAGRNYCVSFYISPTISNSLQYNYIAVDKININFYNIQIGDNTNTSLSLPNSIPNINGTYVTDTAGWTKVSGVYNATGSEQWLTIGCFKNNNSTPEYISVYPNPQNPNYKLREYIYIDDISVTEILSTDTLKKVHDTLICQNVAQGFHLNGSSGYENYLWNTGDTTAQITVNDSGTYWCRASSTCNVFIDTFHVKRYVSGILHLGTDSISCTNQPIVLISNNTYDTYHWNTGQFTNSIIADHTGTYVLTATDICGQHIDSIHITIQDSTPIPIALDTVICQYVDNVVLNIQGTNIKWYNTATDLTGSNTQPYINTQSLKTYVYYVTQKIGVCESPKAAINVKIRYTPESNHSYDTTHICITDTATTIGNIYPDVTYLWNTGQKICCIEPENSGIYSVIIANTCGLSTQFSYVDIQSCDECIKLPNIFTPNNDGHNDYFDILKTCDVINFNIKIYNRWGQMVFSSNDVTKSWDGNFNGHSADVGVYVYELEYQSNSTGIKKQIRGNVSLVK